MSKPVKDDDISDVVRRAVEWLGTDAGLKSTEDVRARAASTKELFEQGHDIDQKKLSEPFTV